MTSLPGGLIYPTWPNGGWSIAAEFHFYLLLPLLLYLARRSTVLPLMVVVGAVALRVWLYQERGEIQSLAYWTIIGRIDQFTIGIVAFRCAGAINSRRLYTAIVALAFWGFWWWFDVSGGFYQRPSYPSPSPVWIILPTVEAIAYGTLIAWYDSRNLTSTSRISKIIQKFGEYSYSIYLFHFFVVFNAARFVHENIMDISNFYTALVWAAITFALMIVPGYLSFTFIESPFLRLRKRYLVTSLPQPDVKQDEGCKAVS